MPRVISIDLARCTFCRSCEVACEREHNGASNMFVQLIDERYAVPVNCHHCQESPCVTVCPTHALAHETPETVTISSMQCIGCGMCVLACPIGAVTFDRIGKIARKCDLCLHRLAQGKTPACVATCSTRALSFIQAERVGEKRLVETQNPQLPVRQWQGALVHSK